MWTETATDMRWDQLTLEERLFWKQNNQEISSWLSSEWWENIDYSIWAEKHGDENQIKEQQRALGG